MFSNFLSVYNSTANAEVGGPPQESLVLSVPVINACTQQTIWTEWNDSNHGSKTN